MDLIHDIRCQGLSQKSTSAKNNNTISTEKYDIFRVINFISWSKTHENKKLFEKAQNNRLKNICQTLHKFNTTLMQLQLKIYFFKKIIHISASIAIHDSLSHPHTSLKITTSLFFEMQPHAIILTKLLPLGFLPRKSSDQTENQQIHEARLQQQHWNNPKRSYCCENSALELFLSWA